MICILNRYICISIQIISTMASVDKEVEAIKVEEVTMDSIKKTAKEPVEEVDNETKKLDTIVEAEDNAKSEKDGDSDDSLDELLNSDTEGDKDEDTIKEVKTKTDIAVPEVDGENMQKLRDEVSKMDPDQLNTLLQMLMGQNQVNPSERDYGNLSKREQLKMKLHQKRMEKRMKRVPKHTHETRMKKIQDKQRKEQVDAIKNERPPEEEKRYQRNKKRRERKKKKLAKIRAAVKAEKDADVVVDA